MRIAILDDYQAVSLKLADWSGLRAHCDIDVFTAPIREANAASVLAPYDILCTLRERMQIGGDLIRALPKLKYIVVTGKRYDAIDVAVARACGVPVSNTDVRGGGGVAELAWGLILACARRIAFEDRMMREGGWQNSIGITLRGRNLGLVGFGNLGRQMAHIGRAFGMNILAWSPNLTPERAEAGGATYASKEELLRQSDIVSLHLVLGATTRGIIGAENLKMMKPDAYLINTARGALIDASALLDALSNKTIAGAGLDVFDQEPLDDNHPLRSLDNVVLTPHLGYYTQEMVATYYEDAIKAIKAFVEGAPIRLVN